MSDTALRGGDTATHKHNPAPPPRAADHPIDDASLNRLGRYELRRQLGQGGMGTVYEAYHDRLRRSVAIKVLGHDRLRSDDSIARFRIEMEAVGQLEHPNIVRAHDADDDQGIHFLVMELVEGLDLSQLVQRIGPLSISGACEITRQVALALQHMHERQMVHRDVKPSNILLSKTGEVKLTDVGLARLQPVEGADALTMNGEVLGTPDYISPEQAMSSHEVDIRADLYSLGATLYFLLTGRPLFCGKKYDSCIKKLLAHANEEPPAPRSLREEIPSALSSITGKLLEKDPERRFQTPGELVETLKPFCRPEALKELADVAAKPPADDFELGAIVRPPSAEPLPETAQYVATPAASLEQTTPRNTRFWLLAAAAFGLLGAGGLGANWYFGSALTEDEQGQSSEANAADKGNPPLASPSVGAADQSTEKQPIVAKTTEEDAEQQAAKPLFGMICRQETPPEWWGLKGENLVELRWPGRQARGSWEFSEKLKALVVSYEKAQFLQLGTIGEQPCIVSIDLEQPRRGVIAGLFFGFGEDVSPAGTPCARMAMVRLMKRANSPTEVGLGIERRNAIFDPRYAQFETDWDGSVAVEWPNGMKKSRLSVQLGPGGIEAIHWNGRPIDRLISGQPTDYATGEDYYGRWGVYCEDGTTWFSNPSVKIIKGTAP